VRTSLCTRRIAARGGLCGYDYPVMTWEKDSRQLIARWGRMWGLPGLEARVRVEWSARLTRSLGQAFPARGIVRLSTALSEQPDGLRAALCHEVAHVAAFELRGRGESPHGTPWRDLVRLAGFEPAVRMKVRGRAKRPSPSPPQKKARAWEHRCPVCHMVRRAGRPVPTWRCAQCAGVGLDGKLVIVKTGT
jgi:predicted SprT family Zn-dependent metalloprotease